MGFNPYFIGLSILIIAEKSTEINNILERFQSLFYWIIYSYDDFLEISEIQIGVSILILLDYLFL